MSPILGIYASSNYQRVTPDNGAMFPIAMAVGTGSSASITFNSIPTTTYKHLQLRIFARNTTSATNSGVNIRFNGDTGNNYAFHYLLGDGSSPAAGGSGSLSLGILNEIPANNATANAYGVLVVDILDAFSTSKNKTIRSLGGYDLNGSGKVGLYSSAWFNNTTAISSITLGSDNYFNSTTQVGLYGIKG
jgi:hypothetical protein